MKASLEENKAVVRRLWEEVWNGRALEVADEIFNREYAEHEKRFIELWCAAFPDTRHTIEEILAEGDKVVTRFSVEATHKGEFMGLPGSGNLVHFRGIWMHRLEDGRIVEGREWGAVDWLSLLYQMGGTIVPDASLNTSTV